MDDTDMRPSLDEMVCRRHPGSEPMVQPHSLVSSRWLYCIAIGSRSISSHGTSTNMQRKSIEKGVKARTRPRCRKPLPGVLRAEQYAKSALPAPDAETCCRESNEHPGSTVLNALSWT
ncbi:hypothetical protein V8C42DRAFT_314605 [Trichoderma barbatum]